MVNACALHRHHTFGEAKSEALRALAVFDELGVVDLAERTRKILEKVEETNWI